MVRAEPDRVATLMSTGIVLAVALAMWALLAHPQAPGSTAAAGLMGIGIVAWCLGAVGERFRPALPKLLVAGAVLVAVVGSLPESLSRSATAPPLGYANANAALITAAVTALVAASSATGVGTATRRLLYSGALLLTLACLLTGSLAAFVASALVVTAWPSTWLVSVRTCQVTAGCVLVGLFGTSFVLGVTYSPAETDSTPAVSALSEARLALWSDAIDLGLDNPVRGTGPGTFSSESPTARLDTDHSWPHSAPLRALAELGFVGLGLLAALIAWMIRRLGRASIALTAMALQPMVDYVLTFWPVVVASCMLLGSLAVSEGTVRSARGKQLTRTL